MCRFFLLSGLLVAAVALTGCESLPGWWPFQAQLDEPFTLGVSQAAQVEDLRLIFLRVLEDSRCPVDVVCVWAGNARVELELILAGAGKSRVLLNSLLEPREASFSGYLIQYIDLKPYPKSTQQIDPRAYHLTLVVSRI